MGKALSIMAMALLTLGLIAPGAYAETEWSGNLNFFFGSKALDKNEWEPVEAQDEFGIMLDIGKQQWPVHLAVDLMVSSADGKYLGSDVEGTTTEFNFGVRKPYDFGNMHPFVGAGLGIMSASLKVGGSGSCDGTGLGAWVDGGVYWTLADSFNIGLDARISSANVDFGCGGYNTVEANAGGGHFGFLIGFHW